MTVPHFAGATVPADSQTFNTFRVGVEKLVCHTLRLTDVNGGLRLEFLHDGICVSSRDVFTGPDNGLLVVDEHGANTITTPPELLKEVTDHIANLQLND
jgi:hypothetical protein